MDAGAVAEKRKLYKVHPVTLTLHFTALIYTWLARLCFHDLAGKNKT
jgi:hypothetical protein